MNLRDSLLRKARKTNCEHDWSTYKRKRNRVTGFIKDVRVNIIKTFSYRQC